MGVGSVLLTCVRLWLVWWDLATSWLYALLHPPAKLRAQHHAVRAVPCKPIAPGDTQVHTPVTTVVLQTIHRFHNYGGGEDPY